MSFTISPVQSVRDLEVFVRFPWSIYQGDPFWVPPILEERFERLDPSRNPFWRGMERELWIARQAGAPVGTIAAFHDNQKRGAPPGFFGFFECIDEDLTAARLLRTAEGWLAERGCRIIRGPYNPSANDEAGILFEGFQTRPSLMEGHNPPYYSRFFDCNGYHHYQDLDARLYRVPAKMRDVSEGLPARLCEVTRRVAKRPDLVIRPFQTKRWNAEIHLACDIYNAALANLPDFLPVPFEEFSKLAESFRPILQPDLALIAEVAGKPVGYALALPDANEALQSLNGRLGPLNMLRLWWGVRNSTRASFKILMILPEYQGRGIEAVLIHRIGQAIINRGFREVDMSLTGDDNEKSSRFQKHLGFKIYRRYRVYQKELTP
jgi:GNAT superfamily N-acetyltransferase